MADTLYTLYDRIKERLDADPSESYVAKMHGKGINKIAQKVGEEAAEVIIAALAETRKDVINESADLLFHLSLLWQEKDIDPKLVMQEIERRMEFSGIEEKKNRSKK